MASIELTHEHRQWPSYCSGNVLWHNGWLRPPAGLRTPFVRAPRPLSRTARDRQRIMTLMLTVGIEASIEIRRSGPGSIDQFLDTFIDQAIEANGCFFAGGAGGDALGGGVFLGLRTHSAQRRLARITAWLDARPDVVSYEVGKLENVADAVREWWAELQDQA